MNSLNKEQLIGLMRRVLELGRELSATFSFNIAA